MLQREDNDTKAYISRLKAYQQSLLSRRTTSLHLIHEVPQPAPPSAQIPLIPAIDLPSLPSGTCETPDSIQDMLRLQHDLLARQQDKMMLQQAMLEQMRRRPAPTESFADPAPKSNMLFSSSGSDANATGAATTVASPITAPAGLAWQTQKTHKFIPFSVDERLPEPIDRSLYPLSPSPPPVQKSPSQTLRNQFQFINVDEDSIRASSKRKSSSNPSSVRSQNISTANILPLSEVESQSSAAYYSVTDNSSQMATDYADDLFPLFSAEEGTSQHMTPDLDSTHLLTDIFSSQCLLPDLATPPNESQDSQDSKDSFEEFDQAMASAVSDMLANSHHLPSVQLPDTLSSVSLETSSVCTSTNHVTDFPVSKILQDCDRYSESPGATKSYPLKRPFSEVELSSLPSDVNITQLSSSEQPRKRMKTLDSNTLTAVAVASALSTVILGLGLSWLL
ncbi:uncharacterized protein V1516DRAFT_682658, partial [Lipomyces oligophaga]|uniref:uncharacterized protein n=1 Tax=Lipomyces oligophaga TaxID=45792 RepID=UPI0034CFC9FE